MPNYRQDRVYNPEKAMTRPQDFTNLAYRGIASALGAPVDIFSSAMRPFGYGIPEKDVVMGSEWIGKQMEDAGLVSSARNPFGEFVASMMIPDPTDIATIAKFAGDAVPALGMFVGASRTDPGAFSNIYDKVTRKWIDDIPAKVKDDFANDISAHKLDDIMQHDELYNKYPELKDVKVVVSDTLEPGHGQFHNGTITMGKGTQDPKDLILHETQHWVQQKEGLARGGSAKNVRQEIENFIEESAPYSDYYKDKLDRAKELGEAASMRREVEKLLKNPQSITRSMLWYEYKPFSIPKSGKARKQAIEEVAQKAIDDLNDKASYLAGDHYSAEKLETITKGVYDEIKTLGANKKHYDLVDKYSKILKENSDYDMYKRLLGEQEARATQAALKHPNLDPWQALIREEGALPEPIIKTGEYGADKFK